MKNILKSSSYLIFAQGLTKVVSFFYTIFLAGSLGVENFGLYVVAMSYFSLVASLTDFGMSQYFIRETSVDASLTDKLLSHIIMLRSSSVSIIFLLFALFFSAIDSNASRVSLVLVAILAALPQAIALSLDSVFVARQKLSFSSLGLLCLSAATTISGLILVGNSFGPLAAVVAVLLGEIIYMTVNLSLVKKLSVRFVWQLSLPEIKKILLGALPYGFLGILGLLYFKVDTLILNYMRGAYDTGIYGAAYKFLEAIVFVPSAISAALFPILSNLSKNSPEQIFKLYTKATFTLLGMSLLVMAAYLIVLPVVINFFLPQYKASIQVIKILSITIPFLFMISPQALVFLSNKRFLGHLIVISVFNLALNIFLNVMLIPQYSYFGSAVVTVISDIVSFLIFFTYIWIKLRPL